MKTVEDHDHRWKLSYPGTDYTQIHCTYPNCQTAIKEPQHRFPECLAEAVRNTPSPVREGRE